MGETADVGSNAVPGWQPARLHAARRARGWTQAQLAAAVGVSRDVVGQWEAGRAPRAGRVAQLAAALGVEPGDLTDTQPGLQALRIAAGLTQLQLGRAIGVSRSTVHSVEHGKFRLSEDLAAAYAAALGVSVASVREAVAQKSRRIR